MVSYLSTLVSLVFLCTGATVSAGCPHHSTPDGRQAPPAAVVEAEATVVNHPAPQTCASDAVAFVLPGDPAKTTNCCTPPMKINWLDEINKIGQCCDEGKFWSGDIFTGIGGCCDSDKHWSQDEVSGLGKCCAPYHEFAGDKATGNGSCCPNGYRWSKGRCQRAPPTQFRAQAPASVEL